MKKIETTADRGQKKPSNWTPARHRIHEVCKLMRQRYGGPCRTDDGSIWLEAVIPSLAAIDGDIDAPSCTKLVISWAAEHVPVLPKADIAVVLSEARKRNKRRRLRLAPAELGTLLCLTVEERDMLGIRMMRPGDMTSHQFKEMQRSRDAERQRARRRKAGAKPRDQSLAATRPWEAEGISRSTYDRRAKSAKSAAGADTDRPRARTKFGHSQVPVGTVDSAVDENSSAISLPLPLRTNFGHATTEPADASRADSSTGKRRRTRTTSGRPANDNRVLKPYRPKRGKRMALVGSVNDNGGDD